VTTLLSQGHLLVGLVVLLCSMVFPLGKLVSCWRFAPARARCSIDTAH
jgi:hypothetical protein